MNTRPFASFFVLALFAIVSAQGNATRDSNPSPISHFFWGTIGNNLEVGVTLTIKGTDVFGTYFYKGRKGEVTLKGTLLADESVTLNETYKGKDSGIWWGRFSMSSRYSKEIQGAVEDPDKTSFTGIWKGPSRPGMPAPDGLPVALLRVDVKACATCASYPNTAAGLAELRGGEKRGPIVSLGGFKYQMLSKSAGKASREYPVFISSPASLNLKKLNQRIVDPNSIGKEEPLDPQCPSSEETKVNLSAPEVLRINMSYFSDCGAHPVRGNRLILMDVKTGTELNWKNIFKNGEEDLIPLLKTKNFDADPECFSDYDVKTYAGLSSLTTEAIEVSFQFPHGSAACNRTVLIPLKDAVKYASKTSILHRLNRSAQTE